MSFFVSLSVGDSGAGRKGCGGISCAIPFHGGGDVNDVCPIGL